jgi:hypothetical protein
MSYEYSEDGLIEQAIKDVLQEVGCTVTTECGRMKFFEHKVY